MRCLPNTVHWMLTFYVSQDGELIRKFKSEKAIYEVLWRPTGTQLVVCGASEDVTVLNLKETPPL